VIESGSTIKRIEFEKSLMKISKIKWKLWELTTDNGEIFYGKTQKECLIILEEYTRQNSITIRAKAPNTGLLQSLTYRCPRMSILLN
jgi:hypothetical protein